MSKKNRLLKKALKEQEISNSIQSSGDKVLDRSPFIPQRAKLKNPLKINERQLTPKQQEFIDIARNKSTKLMLVSGPAGTTKTYLAVLASLLLMNDMKVSDIVYVRSIAESADIKMGSLPGEKDDKLAPYKQPLIDKLEELLSVPDVKFLSSDGRIDGLPVNYLRGLNWNAKAIIADECIAGHHCILTSEGKVSLRSLYKKFNSGKPLPTVLTYNETTGVFEKKSILNVVNKGTREVVRLVFGNREVICTPDHKFLTELGWVNASDLSNENPMIANCEPSLQSLPVMNDDQLQIFIGSYLGDGNVDKVGNNRYRLRVIHGEAQKDYCKWKASIFGEKISFVKNNGYSQNHAYTFVSKCVALPGEIPSGIKTNCPDWVIDALDLRGIAIWYMDDGNINKAKNHIRISTCSFDLESQKKFVEKFKKFGVQVSINEDVGPDWKYYFLQMDAKNSRKFMELISPYIHEDVLYKIDHVPESRYTFSNEYKPYRHIIFDRRENIDRDIEVFDIEVQDNHNFILTSGRTAVGNTGIVTHNCQNMTKEEIVTLMTRIGEFSKVFLLGDPGQSDIKSRSGFSYIFNGFNAEECRENGIVTFEFTEEDILRSALVKFIIKRLKTLK